MVTLVLRCCVCTFSSFGEQGLLFVAVSRLLIAVASCVAEHQLYACGLQQLWHSAPCGIFLDRRSNPCPCIDQWTPNHSTTREARFESCLMRSLHSFFFKVTEILCVFYTPTHLHLEIKFGLNYLVCIETPYHLQLGK